MLSNLDRNDHWILNPTTIEQLLRELHFRDETVQYICNAARQAAGSGDADELLKFCKNWPKMEKQDILKSTSDEWMALAAVYGFPSVIEKHQKRGIPFGIIQDTLLDMQRRMEETYAKTGEWGFDKLFWMRNHLSRDFFEIGRLQYIIGPFGYKFKVYKNAVNNDIISLAWPREKCTANGWITDSDGAFETILEESADGISGNAARADGSVERKITQLPPHSKVLLDDNSTVINIHIPTGDKLTPQRCVDSLKQAKVFFEKYFSEVQIDAFCTGTWLLDPQLQKVLSPQSNIVQFGQLFHPLTRTNADDHQLRERVFGSAQWEDCRAGNSLQRAILAHYHNGGEFRNTAGFILPEEIEEL